MSSVLTPAFGSGSVARMLRRGLTTAAFCVFLAAALTINGGSFVTHLAYSLSNGLIAWLVMDIGRQLFSRDALWPHGKRDFTLVAAGISAGFFGGSVIGDVLTGKPALGLLHFAPGEFAPTLLITMGASIAVCYFYYSRGRARLLEGQLALVQRDATEARLKLLETQLAPHMLFNTLANLRALIATDPPRAIVMLDHLDRYLRALLAGSRKLWHPLSAEFARLGDYLELMSVRMGPRLRYELELPAPLREVPVPPLLLQPLVENAIRHGLEPWVSGGEIHVRARVDGSLLTIDVANSGASLDETAREHGSGFGLIQVRERLASLYGPRATLALAAAPEGGTRATLRLPLSPAVSLQTS